MITRILAWVVVAGVLALGNPDITQAQSIMLVNQQNDRCLDVPNGTSQNGALLIVWNCHGGAGQQFRISVGGNMRDGFIRYGDRCVAAFDDGIRGARVGLWDCVNHPSQQWRLEPDGRLRHMQGAGGLCLGIADASQDNGARLILWDCTVGAANQQWEGAPISAPFRLTVTQPGGAVQITNGMTLDVAWTSSGSAPAAQAEVILREKTSLDWNSGQKLIPLGRVTVSDGRAMFAVAGLDPAPDGAGSFSGWGLCILTFRIAGTVVGESETFYCNNLKR